MNFSFVIKTATLVKIIISKKFSSKIIKMETFLGRDNTCMRKTFNARAMELFINMNLFQCTLQVSEQWRRC